MKRYLPEGYTLFNYIMLALLCIELVVLPVASFLCNANTLKTFSIIVATTGFILLLTDPRAHRN